MADFQRGQPNPRFLSFGHQHRDSGIEKISRNRPAWKMDGKVESCSNKNCTNNEKKGPLVGLVI